MAGQPLVINPLLLLLLLCGVLALWVASWVQGGGPVFLVRPPITRRSQFYQMPLPEGCAGGLQSGAWTDWPLALSCTQQGYATCGEAAVRRWRYSSRAADCGAWRYNRSQAQQLLQGKWVVFAGDSVSRMLYAALLRLAGSPGQEILLKHQDIDYTFERGARATFLWRAYPANLTNLFLEWRQNKTEAPALVVSTASLWHMLHVTDAQVFAEELGSLGEAAKAYLGSLKGGKQPQLLLGSTTDTFTNQQPTRQKREHMTPSQADAYNKAVAEQRGVVGPGAPFGLLDLFELTQGCGEECSIDGIHSVDAVYDAALQLILNLHQLWVKR